ncbi:helix-turn-helix domain-containing protein [Prosthecobacter sp.]|uniref:helix-turn-helix domain-containing protein n=1 Tax=Prosthecobacter sp. TaxID=1965333 RepID=UPI003782F130
MNFTDVRKLSELRSVLEGFAARHAAMNASSAPAALKQLRALLRRVTQAVRQRDYAAFRSADRELHESIIQLADLPLLRETWRRVWDSLLTFHQQGFEDYFPDNRVLADEHEHLVETIALGDPAAAEDAARSHVEAVWFRIAEAMPNASEPAGDPLQRAAAHLAFRLHCPLKLTEVARDVAFTSPGNLSRLFRRRHGLSFQAYLQKLRLEKAAELLSHTRLSVARIARRVGYRDVSRFGQHFKRAFDETPVGYRASRG